MTTKIIPVSRYSSRMRTVHEDHRGSTSSEPLLPGLTRAYATAVLDALDDRTRGDAERHLLEGLKLVVLTDRFRLPVEASQELETVRCALAAHPDAFATLRELIGRQSCAGDVDGARGQVDDGSDHIRCAAAYVQAFGPFTARTVALWPDAQAVMAEVRLGVSGLNDLAADWRERSAEPQVSMWSSPWRALGAVSRVSELADMRECGVSRGGSASQLPRAHDARRGSTVPQPRPVSQTRRSRDGEMRGAP